jgi:hypothetical protein
MGKNYMRKKKLKALGPVSGRIQGWWVQQQQDPKLMGPAAAGPKAILGPSKERTHLEWVLRGKI